MLSAEQLEERKLGIGSSDSAAAIGVSPWKSRAELWLEKTGRAEPDKPANPELLHFGNVLESVVADEFQRRRGLEVQKRRRAYVHPEHEFIRANADRIVLREDSILEAKTADKFTAAKWDEGIPIQYVAQCHHLMLASGRRRVYLAVLIGGNEYRDFQIDHDSETEELLVAREGEFWSYVERDEPPPVSTAEEVLAIYNASNEKTIQASPELVELHSELLQLRAENKRVEVRIDEIKDAFCSFMLDAAIVLGPHGKPLVTWKKTSPKKRKVNHQAMVQILAEKQSIPDEEVAAAEETASYLPKGTRTFLVKEPKEGK